MSAERLRANPGPEPSRAGVAAAWSVLLVLGTLALYWRAPLLGFAGDDALVLYHLKRLGALASRPDGDAQEVRLALAPEVDLGRLRFYYFAEGEVRRVPPVPASWLTPR